MRLYLHFWGKTGLAVIRKVVRFTINLPRFLLTTSLRSKYLYIDILYIYI